MMKLFLALIILFGTTIASADSLSRKIFCESSRYKFLITADITKGSLVLNDDSGNQLDNLKGLIVTIKKVKKNEVIRFKNLKTYSYLPLIVFEAKVDTYGEGTAKSFDDLAGGTTNYKCGTKYLKL